MKYSLLILFFIVLKFNSAQSQDIVSPNGTSGLKVGFHPILAKAKLCGGIDLNNPYNFKKSAFTYSFDSNITFIPEIKIQTFLVKGKTEVNKLINYDSKVEASIPIIGGGEVEIHANVKTTDIEEDIRLVFIATSSYNPEVPDDNQILMTTEAQNLLSEPGRFKRTFGTYFCNAIFKGHRLMCEVTLRKSFASSLYSLFVGGKASINLEAISLDAQTSIRGELKKTVTNNQASMSIEAYGGPELKDYRSIFTTLLKADDNFENVTNFFKTLMTKFEYKNAKPLMCYLSDYSAWGIEDSPLLNDAVYETQKEIKRLYPLVTNEINKSRILISNPSLRAQYTTQQVNQARINSTKLLELRSKMTQTHQKLNLGDYSQIGADITYFEEYYKLKSTNPEIYEYVFGRQMGQPISFIYQISNLPQNLANLKTIIQNSVIYNTFNSTTAFASLEKIIVVNETTNQTVDQIDLASVTSSNVGTVSNNVKVVYLAQLIGSTRIDIFCSNIDNDIVKFFNSVFAGGFANSTEYTRYQITIIDKFGRAYTYPLFNANLSHRVSPPSYIGSISQLGPWDYCEYVWDYDGVGSGGEGGFGIGPMPEALQLNLSQLNYQGADSLFIEIRTNNSLINTRLEQSGEFDLNFGNEDFNDLLVNPNISLSLSSFPLRSFESLIFKWYTKTNTGNSSIIKTKEIPLLRRLCNPTVFLE
jgi:hypothetical protein